ncbi:GIY-YIG nuclease family protein [Candidatus Nomurabacteria bacterium]|nr:GIY-YIG nuclease family protein [Candidatus Nomurabacteria bacterium]
MQLQGFKKYKLPDSPGVYIFKKDKKILYVGKATSLKNRVRSYFSNDLIKTRGPLLVDMVTQANDLDFQKTDSVLEALILEANLIKKHKPIYNTKEKDNKSYNFLVITKEEFPKVLIERGRVIEFTQGYSRSQIKSGATYHSVFGPFPSQQQLKTALKIVRKIFPFLTSKNESKLYQQIGLEPDISTTNAKKEYAKNIRNVSLFFKGKKKELLRHLEKEMRLQAKIKNFEKAAKIRNQIFALNHIQDISLIKNENINVESNFRIEAYDVAHMRGQHSVGVMTVIEDGEVKKSDYRKFILRSTKKGDDVGGLKEILNRRLGHTEWPMPNLIVIDGGKAQIRAASNVFEKVGVDIPIVSVVKDERHRPREILNLKSKIKSYERDILLANSEAHRFAIGFYRSKHRKNLI